MSCVVDETGEKGAGNDADAAFLCKLERRRQRDNVAPVPHPPPKGGTKVVLSVRRPVRPADHGMQAYVWAGRPLVSQLCMRHRRRYGREVGWNRTGRSDVCLCPSCAGGPRARTGLNERVSRQTTGSRQKSPRTDPGRGQQEMTANLSLDTSPP